MLKDVFDTEKHLLSLTELMSKTDDTMMRMNNSQPRECHHRVIALLDMLAFA